MIRTSERTAFETFTSSMPNFAGRPVSCSDGPDPPDFVCTDSENRRLGVELAEWLNEKQITVSKQRQRLREGYASLPHSVRPATTNLGRMRLFPMRTLPATELAQISAELNTLIQTLDQNWAEVSERGNPVQGIPIRDFTNLPLLSRRVAQVDVYPRTDDRPFNLDIFAAGGGPYSPRSAFAALAKILAKKECKYEDLHEDQQLDELYLVLYWWQGYAHNSPYDAPGYGLAEISRDLEEHIRTVDTIFDKIFVCDVPKKKAYVVWSAV